ncbi:MAG: ankyrin repeat domain-containing protein [Deltaproteobacteria bacterium]|nr:ankyrin repeat domain-containing protein [Deltaproteobacteria bacterium]
MSKSSLISLIVGAVAILGAIAFYVWNTSIRPEQEAEREKTRAAVEGCAVHEASRSGDLKLLTEMFAAGCSLNKRNDFGMTALHVASNDRVAEFLITHGANIEALDARGYSPLKVHQMAGRKPVVDLLLKHNASTATP